MSICVTPPLVDTPGDADGHDSPGITSYTSEVILYIYIIYVYVYVCLCVYLYMYMHMYICVAAPPSDQPFDAGADTLPGMGWLRLVASIKS